MDLNLGRDLPTSREGEETRYSIYEDGKRTEGSVYSYGRESRLLQLDLGLMKKVM